MRYYLSKNVVITGAFLKHVKIKTYGDAMIHIGSKAVIQNSTLIASGNDSFINIEGGSTNIKKSFIIASIQSGKIHISSGFTTEGCYLRAHEGKTITIGTDCMFSHGINISTTDYHSIVSIDNGIRLNYGRDITIGNHVWLGQDVDVLKGVCIADDIIVGMGSVVSKSLNESHSVYVGSPAYKVKSDVTWTRHLI